MVCLLNSSAQDLWVGGCGVCVCACVSVCPLEENLTLVCFLLLWRRQKFRKLFQQKPEICRVKLWPLADVLRPEETGCYCNIITIVLFQSFSLSVISKNRTTSSLPESLVFSDLILLIFLCSSGSQSSFGNVLKNICTLFWKFLVILGWILFCH